MHQGIMQNYDWNRIKPTINCRVTRANMNEPSSLRLQGHAHCMGDGRLPKVIL